MCTKMQSYRLQLKYMKMDNGFMPSLYVIILRNYMFKRLETRFLWFSLVGGRRCSSALRKRRHRCFFPDYFFVMSFQAVRETRQRGSSRNFSISSAKMSGSFIIGTQSSLEGLFVSQSYRSVFCLCFRIHFGSPQILLN